MEQDSEGRNRMKRRRKGRKKKTKTGGEIMSKIGNKLMSEGKLYLFSSKSSLNF
jgi:hypothetical protein